MNVDARCRAVRLILSDVDGVLTDGMVTYDNHGVESKSFNIRDGLAVKLWHRAGNVFGLITSRSSHVVQLRASELGITVVRQGVEDKLPAVRQVLALTGCTFEQLCYIGDDLPDLPVVRSAILGVAVADACQELKDQASLVTKLGGGQGAIRETVEMILKAQNRWTELLQNFTA